jgi:hypothetical protein
MPLNEVTLGEWLSLIITIIGGFLWLAYQLQEDSSGSGDSSVLESSDDFSNHYVKTEK